MKTSPDIFWYLLILSFVAPSMILQFVFSGFAAIIATLELYFLFLKYKIKRAERQLKDSE